MTLRCAYVLDTMADVRMVRGLAARTDLTLVGPSSHAERLTTWSLDDARVDVVVLRGGRRRFVAAVAWWLLRNRRRFDAVFVLDDLVAALGANVARALGGPAVVLQLGRPTVAYVRAQRKDLSRLRHAAKVAIARLVTGANHRLADEIGAVSQACAESVGRPRSGGADPIAWYGVDPEVFAPRWSRREAKERLDLPLDRPVVLYRSRIAAEKDPETFLRAIRLLRAEGRQVEAVFKGGEQAEMGRRAEAVGVDVRVSGAVHPHELPQWYAAADVVVQTSHEEGLGVSVLEALACGTPAVVTNAGGLPEAVGYGRGGLVVPVGDDAEVAAAIAWLLDHPDDAARIGAAGRAYVIERFAADDVFDAWVRLAEGAVARRSRGRGRP